MILATEPKIISTLQFYEILLFEMNLCGFTIAQRLIRITTCRKEDININIYIIFNRELISFGNLRIFMDSRELIFGISKDFRYSTVNWILGFAKISWIQGNYFLGVAKISCVQQGNELAVGIC